MTFLKTLFIFLILVSTILGEENAAECECKKLEINIVSEIKEVKAVIRAPTEVLAGTLVFLSNEESVGDNKVWIIPDELKTQSAACGNSIFFVLPVPGNYKFGIIVANKTANIDYIFITIKAVGTVSPPSSSPPSSGFLALRKVSQAGSSFLLDNETSKKLNIELTRLSTSIINKTLPEAKAEVIAGLDKVFLSRSYESRKKDWITNWRIPIGNELDRLNLDIPTYSAALLAIANSLCIDGKCPLIQ